MFILSHQLDDATLTDLNTLSLACKKEDGHHIALYPHLLREQRPAPSILYYQEKTLIGFLSLYFFYDEACELSVMVAPASRRRGIASRLFLEARPLLLDRHIPNLVFSTPHGLDHGWLVSRGCQYEHTEYEMQWPKGTPPPLPDTKTWTIRKATLSDLQALCAIDNACFPTPLNNIGARIERLLTNPAYTLFVAQKEGALVGKAHVCWHKDGVYLTDIGILPPLQGQGFGSFLLAHCIDHVLSKGESTIRLTVETSNKKALGLYTRLGFVLDNAHDFWRTTVAAFPLQSHLSTRDSSHGNTP